MMGDDVAGDVISDMASDVTVTAESDGHNNSDYLNREECDG